MFKIGDFEFKVINDFTKKGEETPLIVVENISTEFESCEKDFNIYKSLMNPTEFEKLSKLVSNISMLNKIWKDNELNYNEYLTVEEFEKYQIDKYIFNNSIEDIAQCYWKLDKSNYLLKYYDPFTAGVLFSKDRKSLEQGLWDVEKKCFGDNQCVYLIGNKDMQKDFNKVCQSGCCGSFYLEFEFKGELFGAHCNYGH